MVNEFWQGLHRSRRVGLVAGAAVILAVTVALAAFLFRTDYDVLFANLAPADASSMTAELDRMKLPYRIGGDGTTILVDRNTVHATRLKLMGKDLPLHGAVGFELFNNADFGMTEFAQKINYQRALQGEITRTILSLSEIESARVHLAFPEESLFKREQSKAKASISLALRHGQSLRPDQVSGIQRLVAAAVTGIAADDVTIVNQEGVALTRTATGNTESAAPARLDLKADIEQALGRKVARILDKTFGEGHAMASVDVALDMSQVRVTTEDVRGQSEKPGDAQTGVVVRERETVRDEAALAATRDHSGGGSYRETEYQVGRRVEQVITQPGSIQRLQVVAVIRDPLDATQTAQVKTMIAAAVGSVAERGDTVVVHSMGAFAVPGRGATAPTLPEGAALTTDEVVDTGPDSATAPSRRAAAASERWIPVATVLAVVAVLIGVLAWNASRTRRLDGRPGAPMSPRDRDAALARLRQWMSDTPTSAQGEAS